MQIKASDSLSTPLIDHSITWDVGVVSFRKLSHICHSSHSLIKILT